ncbi:MAG: N-acetylmuramoyl-L-alanine amidase [Rhodobacterales bacterium]|nr:N-acetylmuramoyl-L-alanine amidase [Rhodobacterales bacterium]MDX5392116.1 N-acetylmuramoyl-L-alanine amidase [Rhodobacterales bacterium]MDX5491807.1 N-acetylmuramoyl-L-alanine amidase [Rhodobacterales bacterium]
MSRVLNVIAAVMLLWGAVLATGPVLAQSAEFTALARVDAAQSGLSQAEDRVTLDLALSQGVPYRAYTLEAAGDVPRRLVLDFREVDWQGLTPDALGQVADVTGLRFGAVRPGWSRMVLDLARPLVLDQAGLRVAQDTGVARLRIVLRAVSAAEFTALSGAPHDPAFDLPAPEPVDRTARPRVGEAPLVVVLDPGHGGIDPGAERDGLTEKELMLTFARELQDVLVRDGSFEVVLTRTDDSFVSLDRRVAIAHSAGGQVFISLHADALSEGQAHGATVHLLSDSASDAASATLAERHDRDDLLAGIDLTGQDDQVAGILMDLARQETQPRAERLAQALVAGIKGAELPLNSRPVRRAAFSVLKAADIPSILLEVGFLSSPRDLKNLRNPDWRLQMAEAIREGLTLWVAEDSILSDLVRQ